ncbi:MAG: T6SS immunity protein Tli4 family protein [Massilia sp.]
MKRAQWRGTVAFAILVALVLIAMSSVREVHGLQDRKKVAEMTEKMKTVCVGRFLIDVPENAVVTLSRAFIDGFDIVTRVEGEPEFNHRVRDREAEINNTRNDLGRKNMEVVKQVRSSGLSGKIFVFGRWRTSWMEGEKQIHAEAVAIEGHIRTDGVSFSFQSKHYDPKLVGNLPKLLTHLVQRGEFDIPVQPGFCIDRAIVRDPLTPDQTETVTMFAGLPGHPDLGIVFSSMAGTKRGPGMLARSAASTEKLPLYAKAAFRTLREGVRTINGLAGEELAVKVTEANFTSGFNFDWEMGGREDDVFAPFLTLELQTGIGPRSGGKPVQSSLAEPALVDLWDKISSSIRLRPASPPKAASVDPVVPPIGSYASAGDICPHTGWWLCTQGDEGVSVLGGQRQYLKKGQRMPQALLLPRQTLWQRVRGLQPSYESSAPTAWKLVDKRSYPRLKATDRLASATVVARADATGSTGGPAAPVGSYVKTGAPCPASGWWRCEEPHALDGTRWFAQDSLLPVATFQVPARAFGRSTGGPDIIQRRSTWQLLRYSLAPEPVHAQAGAGNPHVHDTGHGPLGPDKSKSST